MIVLHVIPQRYYDENIAKFANKNDIKNLPFLLGIEEDSIRDTKSVYNHTCSFFDNAE